MLRPLLALTAALILAPAFAAQPKGGSGFPGPNPRPDAPRPSEAAPAEAAPATPATPAAPTGMLLDRVVAIANDGIVMQSELDEQVNMIAGRLQQQNTPLPPADVLRRQVLERLVMQELQLQRAERVGIKVGDEQINAALADDAKRNNLTLQQLPAALASEGIDYASYRDNMRKEITLVLLRRREVLSRINVTPRELDQFIERMKKLPGEGDEYNISHILIAVPADSNQAQSDELAKKAEEVYERARTEDFGRLAIAFSNSQTALEGGALGWRKGPELPTVLAELIVALKPGEVSKPLATPNGFHIVKLNAMRSAAGNPIEDQIHARHILMRPNTLQDDATVRQKLAGIREKVLAGEDFAVFASSMSEDSGSAVQGGDLGWSGPGSFVPEFEAELAKLKDNEMSEPFHSQFGWHLVQVLGRRQFDTTEDALRGRALEQLRESKADEETEVWLRRMRDESFVNLNP
jgi:peptidyl-prolyl cis-trans isomerase SurA